MLQQLNTYSQITGILIEQVVSGDTHHKRAARRINKWMKSWPHENLFRYIQSIKSTTIMQLVQWKIVNLELLKQFLFFVFFFLGGGVNNEKVHGQKIWINHIKHFLFKKPYKALNMIEIFVLKGTIFIN